MNAVNKSNHKGVMPQIMEKLLNLINMTKPILNGFEYADESKKALIKEIEVTTGKKLLVV